MRGRRLPGDATAMPGGMARGACAPPPTPHPATTTHPPKPGSTPAQPPTVTNFQSFGGRGFGRRPAHDAVYEHSLDVTWPGAEAFPGVMVSVKVFLHPYV